MANRKTPPVQPHLRAIGLELHKGGRHVLRGVTADFERAAATAVVGPSGAGKTTLLRCINRLEQPSGGRVLLDDIDTETLDPKALRRRVGMIGQTPVVFSGGVRANLAYGLPHADDDVMVEALEAVGLPASFLERESFALSVGQAQRVCMARALVRRPEVLLMDEPTSALDRDATRHTEDLVASLVAAGLTIVLVTHDLAHAGRVAKRAVLLVNGAVVAAGDPEVIADAWVPGRSS